MIKLMLEDESLNKNFFHHRLKAALLIFAVWLFFAIVINNFWTLISFALFTGFVFIVKKPFEPTFRKVVYIILVPFALSALIHILTRNQNTYYFGYTRIFFFHNFFTPLILSISLLASLFYKSKVNAPVMIIAGAVINLIMVSDWTLHAEQNNVFAVLGIPITLRMVFYTVTAIVVILVMEQAYQLNPLLKLMKSTAKKQIIRLGAFVFALLVIGLAGVFYKVNSNAFAKFDSNFLNAGIKFDQKLVKQIFSDEINLDSDSENPFLNNSDQVMVRIISKINPNYLRRATYSFFSEDKWQVTREKFYPLEARIMKDNSVSTEFTLGIAPQKDSDRNECEIFLSSALKRHMVYPSAFYSIVAAAEAIKVSGSGNLQAKDFASYDGYKVKYSLNSDGAFNYDFQTDFSSYLQLDESVAKDLALWLKKYDPENKLQQEKSLRKRLAILREKFKGFSYSLDIYKKIKSFRQTHSDEKTSILQFFLWHNNSGHCEMFATSGAMILRYLKVPTRYVVGYICKETSPDGYWLSRSSDAHAWFEAFDEQEKKWVLVDLTPAGGAGEKSYQWSFYRRIKEKVTFIFQKGIAAFRRGEVVAAIGTFFRPFLEFIWSGMQTFSGIMVFIAMLILLFGRFILKFIIRLCAKKVHDDFLLVKKEIFCLSNVLFNQTGLKRRNGESLLHYFSSQDLPIAISEELQNWCEGYYRLRFSKLKEKENIVDEIEKLCYELEVIRKKIEKMPNDK